MLVLTLLLALVVGLSLGLLGGGGSILTVPILTGVAGMAARPAIASSLLIVAVTSAAACVPHALAGRVRWRIAGVLGGAGMIGAYLGGRLSGALPARVLMILFALMMAATAIAMLRGRRQSSIEREPRLVAALAIGAGIGVVAGTVGAGGGFLIVPALVLIGGLPTDRAIGTSLVVIALQSAAAFAGHLGHVALDLRLTLAVAAVAVCGSVIGSRLVGRLAAATLRRGFGVVVAAMAVWIFVLQLV